MDGAPTPPSAEQPKSALRWGVLAAVLGVIGVALLVAVVVSVRSSDPFAIGAVEWTTFEPDLQIPVAVDILDDQIVVLSVGADAEDPDGPALFSSKDGLEWQRRSLPPVVDPHELSYRRIENLIYVRLSRTDGSATSWVTDNVGVSWDEVTWDHDSLDLRDLELADPAIGARRDTGNGRVDGRVFYTGFRDTFGEFGEHVLPAQEALVARFGAGARLAVTGSSSEFGLEARVGGAQTPVDVAVTVDGATITLVFSTAGSEFHRGQVVAKDGQEADAIAAFLRSNALALPGWWWSDDGRHFGWEPLSPFIADGLRLLHVNPAEGPRDRSTLAAVSVGNDDSREVWWIRSSGSLSGSVDFLIADFIAATGRGDLLAFLSFEPGGSLEQFVRVTPGAGRTFDRYDIPTTRRVEGGGAVHYSAATLIGDRLLLTDTRRAGVAVLDLENGEWEFAELPARPESEVLASDTGHVLFASDDGSWWFGRPGGSR